MTIEQYRTVRKQYLDLSMEARVRCLPIPFENARKCLVIARKMRKTSRDKEPQAIYRSFKEFVND